MNDEFKNSYEENEETATPQAVNEEAPKAEESDYASAAEPANEPAAESAEFVQEQSSADEIPTVEAQKIEESSAPPEPQAEPSYREPQNFSQGYPPYSSNPQQTYSTYNQAPVAPIQTSKGKKGMKIFVACVSLVVVFAMIFGVTSIIKASKDDGGSSGNQNSNANHLNINESPITPTAVSIDGPLSTAEVAAKVRPSIVGIVVYVKNSNSSAGEGTGVIMGEDATGEYTYIITCAHVISDAGITVRVQTEDGTNYDAEIVGYDTRTDLGVIKIKATGLTAAEFGNSDSLRVGDSVYAMGNPGGVEFFGSFTGGFVSAIDRPVSSEIGYTMKCIQHDAAINPGNSGGALINVYGQVIGINSQKIAATDYEGMGFAIPMTSAKTIIDDLINFSYVPNRPMLGITYYPVSASAQYSMIAQIKGLPSGTLIINEIGSESTLANSKVKQYDMITAVNGEPLTTADVLLEKIDNGKVGDKMTLTICRVNSNYTIDEFEFEATLVEDRGNTPSEATTAPYINPFEYFGRYGY